MTSRKPGATVLVRPLAECYHIDRTAWLVCH